MATNGLLGDVRDDATLKPRLDFAQRAFTNAQELNRFMDQKAGYLLSALSLFTLALGLLAARALDAGNGSDLHWGLGIVAQVLFLAYVVLAFLVISYLTRVLRAMPHRTRPRSKTPGLLFPLLLLSRVRSGDTTEGETYFARLNQASMTDILRDYADQIVEVSAIYEYKQQQINQSTRFFQWLAMCWLLTMIMLLAVLVIK